MSTAPKKRLAVLAAHLTKQDVSNENIEREFVFGDGVEVHGYCDPKFQSVQKAFETNFKSHGEEGASVCVYHEGRCVVDLWASKSNDWNSDSIVNVYSCTKGLTALCAHILVDRGQLDLDKPVAHYWPGFEKNGKENITVRHCMSHCAGLRGIRQKLPSDAANNWNVVCDALANETPEYEIGSGRHGYHAMTYGWLVGEVIRRVSGKTVNEFFQEEVGEPFNVDFICGVKKEEDHKRIIDVIQPTPMESSEELKELVSINIPGFEVNSRATREAEIPAANGHTNARGLARMYAILAAGGDFDGKHLISQNALTEATKPLVKGHDETIMMETCWSSGFMKFALPDPDAFGHAGYGGSIGFADPKNEISFGYAQSLLTIPDRTKGDPRLLGLLGGLYGDLTKARR